MRSRAEPGPAEISFKVMHKQGCQPNESAGKPCFFFSIVCNFISPADSRPEIADISICPPSLVNPSPMDIQSPEFEQARLKWEGVLQDFEDRLKEVSLEGTDHSCSRHQERGQLLRASPHAFLIISMIVRLMLLPTSARDRIALLLDFDSPFLELGPFAGHRLPNSNNGANIIAGIGTIR